MNGINSDYPQIYPHLVNRVRDHSHFFQESSLRPLHLVQIWLRVEIRRRLDPCLAKYALHRIGAFLQLVDKPVTQAVTQVMEAEASAFWNPAFHPPSA
jgi:hypothetical protein